MSTPKAQKFEILKTKLDLPVHEKAELHISGVPYSYPYCQKTYLQGFVNGEIFVSTSTSCFDVPNSVAILKTLERTGKIFASPKFSNKPKEVDYYIHDLITFLWISKQLSVPIASYNKNITKFYKVFKDNNITLNLIYGERDYVEETIIPYHLESKKEMTHKHPLKYTKKYE